MSTVKAPADERSRLGLSRERIVEAGIALLDRDGLERFGMRRLADELGVGTMTIYGYFRGKDELLDAIVDAGTERITIPPLHGSWRARLRALMLTLHETLSAHPGVVELRFKRPLISAGALRFTEAGMRVLSDAGFSKQDAARAYRALFIYTFGYSAFGPGRRGPLEREQTEAALANLPADEFPHLIKAASEAANAMADDDLFEFGLERLLDGLERRL